MPLVSRKKKKKIIWGLFHGVLVSITLSLIAFSKKNKSFRVPGEFLLALPSIKVCQYYFNKIIYFLAFKKNYFLLIFFFT